MKRITTLTALLAVAGALAIPAGAQASLPTGGKCSTHTSTASGTQGVVSVYCTYTWNGRVAVGSGSTLP